MDQNDLVAFLESDGWRSAFDAGPLTAGRQMARARQVAEVHARVLDTGDLEVQGVVTEKTGTIHRPELIFWHQGEATRMDADCTCGVGAHCVHAVGILENLLKAPAARVASAFGEAPHAEHMLAGKKILRLEKPPAAAGEEVFEEGEDERACRPRFLMRVEKRLGGERLAWMPEFFAQAQAVYGKHRVDLDPSGTLPAIVTGSGSIRRDRSAEGEAVQSLYALNLLPGAEKPPSALRRIDPAPVPGTLWKVDAREWPHPEFFWQRFRHEGVPALERRGWEVQFAADVGMRPLVFKTEGWKAEIVEEGRGWFRLSAGFEIDGERFALQPILASLVANRFLEATEDLPAGQEFMIFLPDGRGLALPVGRFRRILTTLGQLMEFPFPDGDIRLNKVDAALLAGGEEEAVFGVETSPEIEALAARMTDFEAIERVPLPDGLQATLRDYQADGFYWMQFLARYQLHGILADDMGLGKTLQTLAHILAEKETGRSGALPSLVVAPTSVVVNWQREAAKFSPALNVLVLQGADRHRSFGKIPDADIVLTSYALVPRDLERFAAYHFHLCVLDEAQHVKNPGAQISVAVREINAVQRLCLSGTPIENSLTDLWSLMDFLMPGLLGTSEAFAATYRRPIESGGDGAKAAALARRVGPLILRRTKHDVAKELPPKTEILHTIQLEGEQQDLYETVRSTMDKQVRQALAIRGTEAQIVFLDALLKLRQICCHPSLLRGSESGAGSPEAVVPATATTTAAPASAKFAYLADLLVTLRAEGHRTLLFSQFTSMLAILEAHLKRENCPYLILTGRTKDRQSLVERWQGGEGEVFLISLKAGGTGLTLTGADTVIHYDPWWNPAAENQATDRAYRIGQDKPVFVHKLLCKDTVEERIQQLQGKKDDLATDLLTGATHSLDLSADTMRQLLS